MREKRRGIIQTASLTLVIPTWAHKNRARLFDGVNVHRIFTKTPSHLPKGEGEKPSILPLRTIMQTGSIKNEQLAQGMLQQRPQKAWGATLQSGKVLPTNH